MVMENTEEQSDLMNVICTIACLVNYDLNFGAKSLTSVSSNNNSIQKCFPRKINRDIRSFTFNRHSTTIPEAPADSVPNTRQFKAAYTREVTNTRAAFSAL